MADFIKIEGIDDNPTTDTNVDDKSSAYLDSLMGVDSSASTDSNEDTSTKEGDGDKKSEDNQRQPEKSGDAGSGSGKDTGTQPKPQDQKGKKDEGNRGGANNGDLTLQDGTVVKGGAERRQYELRRNAEQQLSMRTNELQQANHKIERITGELTTLKSSMQSLHGADPAHVSTGIKLVKDLQRDPVGTLKNLLTEAVAAGYTIEGIAQGIDVSSIRDAITQSVRPLLDAQQQQESQQETDRRIEQEVTNFYQSFPDATIHDDVIAAVISKNPQMSLSDAYFQLKNAAIMRGLDWTQPLAPQMQASEQQQPQKQQEQKPMPNGRGPSGDRQVASADRNVVAHESTSTGDIVKEAMREAGLKI